MSRTIIPFGPQHPVLPEPIHLQLVMDNETVVEALPKLGYVHRGLETLTTLRDYNQMIYIVERVCGICSCIHALCFCRAIEHLMDVEVPRRAAYLRIIWSELHRMHSHLLWLGLFADALGFESLFMQFWKIRERIMDINEATAGNRVITILEDASGRYQPLQWANVAIEMAGRIGATVIVCERNQGGDMVAQTLRSAGWTGRIEEVTATKGKATRAEPIAALYERGLVRHAYVMPKLEEQLCSMTSDFDSASAGWSPDRADALVWACTFLHPPVTAPGRPVTKPAARPKHRW